MCHMIVKPKQENWVTFAVFFFFFYQKMFREHAGIEVIWRGTQPAKGKPMSSKLDLMYKGYSVAYKYAQSALHVRQRIAWISDAKTSDRCTGSVTSSPQLAHFP